MRFHANDTIAAVATSPGESGIGIVRISGKDAVRIAAAVFRARDRSRPHSWQPYTMHYGWIVNPVNPAEIIDEVLLSVMRAPKSYTREDVVEINCHGGFVAVRAVLDAVLGQGCRLAQPGEFTRRAFLSGRIDLSQAEAVLDIIRARTDAALRLGMEQLRGALSRRLARVCQILLDQEAALESQIDFPEEGIEVQGLPAVREALAGVMRELEAVLSGAMQGRIFREGLHVVICGRPNVGKSSLLNALLKHERSIVTPVAGTTRDTIEEVIDIRGIPVRIVDTAGIAVPRDLVAHKAVERSRRHIRLCDLALAVFDASRGLTPQDRLLIRALQGRSCLAVLNKIDLRQRLEETKLKKHFRHIVRVSAKRLTNLPELEQAIADAALQDRFRQHEPVLVSNRRHAEKLRAAQKSVAETLKSLDNGLPIEFVAQTIKESRLVVEEVLGRHVPGDILERIFSQFCVGK